MNAARFARFACIDWSGAKGQSHAGIAIAVCEIGQAAPVLISPPRRFWSRKDVLNWILTQTDNILIGMDFSFAPPFVLRGSYLPQEHTANAAKAFWRYVDAVCEDEDLGAASFVETHHRRHFFLGKADGQKSDFIHLRTCEAHYNANGGNKPSSIFDAIGAAQVCKSSFAGMRLLAALEGRVPIWPFDDLQQRGPALVEIYTTIAARAVGMRKGLSKIRNGYLLDRALHALGSDAHAPLARYSDHATDALLTAAWMRKVAPEPTLWSPPLLSKHVAETEGWTLGII